MISIVDLIFLHLFNITFNKPNIQYTSEKAVQILCYSPKCTASELTAKLALQIFEKLSAAAVRISGNILALGIEQAIG